MSRDSAVTPDGSAAVTPDGPAAVSTGGSAAATLMTASGGLVGLLSYACTLAMAHLLPAAGFTAFAAASGLLGVAGVAAAALIPFPLAHAVRAHPQGTPGRRDALLHAAGVALLVGGGAALALGAVTYGFGGGQVALATAVSAFALFLVAPVWGHLQGEGRFGRYSLLTVLEVLVRLALSVLAARAGYGAAGPVGAYAAGAVVVLLLGAFVPLRDTVGAAGDALRDRARWRETAGVGLVQAALSALAVADAVVLAYVPTDPVAAAGYQAVTTLAKAPVYVAVGTALVGFPAIRAVTGEARDVAVAEALRAYGRLVVPAAAVVATLPPALALLVLPAQYAPALALLPVLAVAGLGLGSTTVFATLLLAARATSALVTGLAGATVLLGAGLAAGAPGGVAGLARGAAFGAGLGAVWVIVVGRRRLAPAAVRAGREDRVLLVALGIAATLALLVPARSHPVAWLGAVLLIGLVVVAVPYARNRAAARSEGPAAAPGRLRILHLGFEDPAMPGSGGGALRTREIDGRLAREGHAITVLTQRFPGCPDRTEDGVRWVHIGPFRGSNRLSRLLGYLLALPSHVRASTADLVVEDFFAPISSCALPAFSPRPTAGVVQWLNARDKAREYHVPVHWVERFAVRRHRHLTAVSEGVAAKLRRLAPRAAVTVIGNGVDPLLFRTHAERTDDVVFVGRLEIGQKGLDLLLDAWEGVSRHVPGTLVLAGTGPDEAALRDRVAAAGLQHRVRFAGWVAGEGKARLLASARVAVVPSRFETFGIVAVEALATGTPVVAFDIDCLREVVPPDLGMLVPLSGLHEADAAAFGVSLRLAWADDRLCDRVAERGPAFARRYDWDTLAARQEEAWLRAAGVARHAPASRGLLPVGLLLAEAGPPGRHRRDVP